MEWPGDDEMESRGAVYYARWPWAVVGKLLCRRVSMDKRLMKLDGAHLDRGEILPKEREKGKEREICGQR